MTQRLEPESMELQRRRPARFEPDRKPKFIP